MILISLLNKYKYNNYKGECGMFNLNDRVTEIIKRGQMVRYKYL